MQKLYYWLRKSVSKDQNFYDIKYKLNSECNKGFTQKELEKIENDTFIMEKPLQEQQFDEILINLKAFNGKKTLGLIHFLIKAMPIKSNMTIYEKIKKYDLSLYFKKEKYESNEEKNLFSFINKYMQYLVSISFHSNIYKEELFKIELDFFNNVQNRNYDSSDKFKTEIFKNDPIFVMDHEKHELISQALYQIVNTIEDQSKLESISMTKDKISIECVESDIVNFLQNDLSYFYTKFLNLISENQQKFEKIHEQYSKFYTHQIYEYYRDLVFLTKKVMNIFTGYMRLFPYIIIKKPKLYVINPGFNKLMESLVSVNRPKKYSLYTSETLRPEIIWDLSKISKKKSQKENKVSLRLKQQRYSKHPGLFENSKNKIQMNSDVIFETEFDSDFQNKIQNGEIKNTGDKKNYWKVSDFKESESVEDDFENDFNSINVMKNNSCMPKVMENNSCMPKLMENKNLY